MKHDTLSWMPLAMMPAFRLVGSSIMHARRARAKHSVSGDGRCIHSTMASCPGEEPTTVSIDALEAAKAIAESTHNFALSATIQKAIIRNWLEKAKADLVAFDTFFRATEASRPADLVESGFDEAWLKPLLEPVISVANDSRAALLARAAEEGVRLFHASEAKEAADQFHRDGFVVLLNALEPGELHKMKALSVELIRIAVDADPHGNRGRRRYSLGRTTLVGASLSLASSPVISNVLQKIWDSDSFNVQCTGGDFSFPGAERQDLHADVPVKQVADQLYAHYDPQHPQMTFMDLPTPVVKVYFPIIDLDERTGPPRFVPGSHNLTAKQDVPPPDREPPTVRAFCPAGSAIIMDQRVWHGGTQNASGSARPMLSVHYAGPRYSETVLRDGGSIPFFGSYYWCYHRGAITRQTFEALTLRGQQLCENLCEDTGSSDNCAHCGRCIIRGRSGLPTIGKPRDPWLCLACWTKQRDSFG